MKTDKPIIAVSCDVSATERIELRQEYIDALTEAGAIAVIVPPLKNFEDLSEWFDAVRPDALLLTGGCDIDPAIYGDPVSPHIGRVNRQRDDYELAMTKIAAKMELPILGICRGLQVINTAFGGTLYQDIEHELGFPASRHDQAEDSCTATHEITVAPATKTYTLLYEEKLMTNSHHHQSVKTLGRGLQITAKSDDGIVEAVEHTGKNIVGVQFHPERMENFSQFFINWLKTIF